MYARPPVPQGPRTSDLAVWPAPTGGLVASRNFATPAGTPAATMLVNFFPTATGITIRRGSQLYSTVGGGLLDVEEMFTYISGLTERFYAATADTIYDITVPLAPVAVLTGLTSGDWVVTQFATTGGTFLVGVNGADDMVIFDGSFWYSVPAGNNYKIPYNTGTGAFTVGQVVTGMTTSAKGTILSKHGTVATGALILTGVTGTFIAGETLDDPLTGSALAASSQVSTNLLYTLPYDTGTVAFSRGATITGATSGATAVVSNIAGNTAAGTLIIYQVIGTFQDNETITGSSGGSAKVNGTQTQRLAGITGLPDGISTAIWSYVWIYQNRLFFVEKDTLNAWYLAVDSIGGAATVFPLGGVYTLGGSLLFGSTWSIETGSGLDARCVFVTGNESNSIGNEGEIAVYSGLDPSDPNQWGLIGIYRSGMPMGKTAHISAAGDIIIATDLGLVPLSVAVQRNITELAASSFSYAIEDEWANEVGLRSSTEWKCKIWPTGRMMIVQLPTILGFQPKWLVGNVRTGAWTVFSGWDAKCMAVYQDRLFFGSTGGKIVEAMVTGMDQGLPYTATLVPLFEDMGSPASRKIPTLARAVMRSPVRVNPSLKMQTDFKIVLQPAPAAMAVASGAIWGGGATWGEPPVGSGAKWGGGEAPPLFTFAEWQSMAGFGDTLAPALRLTSGATQPLDAELVRIDALHTVAEVVS